jgi:hypothetical protein
MGFRLNLQLGNLNLGDNFYSSGSGKSGEEIGLKQCVSHHLHWWCMATWRNRILELEIGGGEKKTFVFMYVWMFVREGKKTWSRTTWLQQDNSIKRSDSSSGGYNCTWIWF